MTDDTQNVYDLCMHFIIGESSSAREIPIEHTGAFLAVYVELAQSGTEHTNKVGQHKFCPKLEVAWGGSTEAQAHFNAVCALNNPVPLRYWQMKCPVQLPIACCHNALDGFAFFFIIIILFAKKKKQ